MSRVREKINNVKNWQVALALAGIGLIVFAPSLGNSFVNDDLSQIVNNPTVHSISNIKEFFEGGSFYSGNSVKPLVGIYYRPLMTTFFSLIYSLFGAKAFWFHFFQLLLCIGSAILLYLLFKFSFNRVLAFALALVFLVHPIDSQIVYSIQVLQDALFMFFGLLGLYILIKYKSLRSLFLVAICFFLSLLSKETGILFVAIALLYLFWFDGRRRLLSFASIISLPIALWLLLRIHAVGLNSHSVVAPIDFVPLSARIMTMPSIILFYITKFIFPWKLASAYYWVYPSFSFQHVLLPLIIDMIVIGAFVWLGFKVHRKAPKSQYYTYLLFASWAAIGLLAHMQIIPLDMTACEVWFIFPMVGVLGMIGVLLETFRSSIRPSWFLIVAAVLLVTFCVRTGLRGPNWNNTYTLATYDIKASKEDYVAYENIGETLLQNGDFNDAETYISRSINIQPNSVNYNDLGLILGNLKDYSGATNAYYSGLQYGNFEYLYDNIGDITLVYGQAAVDKAFLLQSLSKFPDDSKLWMFLAILYERNNDNADAEIAISNAEKYDIVPQTYYDGIMSRQPFMIGASNLGTMVSVN